MSKSNSQLTSVSRRASHSPPPAISQSGNSDFSGPLTPTDSRSISPHSPTHSVLPNVEAPFPPLATAAASSSQHGITADDRHSGATPAPALPPSTPSSSSAHANAPVPSANAARSPEGQLIKRVRTCCHVQLRQILSFDSRLGLNIMPVTAAEAT